MDSTPAVSLQKKAIMRQIKPSIVDEEMEGELLAIDDMTGTYFAVRGSGLWLWRSFRSGADIDQIKAVLDPSVGPDVDAFVAGLEAAGLLVESTTTGSTVVVEAPVPWTTPEFEVHDDLQDLLLLDPIHEVTEDGWPNMGTSA